MLCMRTQYYRLITDIFIPPRRSFTRIRQLEDLQQLYELLKYETLCKVEFSFVIFS